MQRLDVRYCFTNHGPFVVQSESPVSAAQVRREFAKLGITVTRWCRMIDLYGWLGVRYLRLPRKGIR